MKRFVLKTGLACLLGLTSLFFLLGLMTRLGSAINIAYAAGPRYVAPGGADSSNDCSNSATPCATIQHAVDVAAPGDTIKVAAGIYTGVNNMASYTQVVYIDKPLTLQGGYTSAFTEPPDPTANPTILDAQGQGRVIFVKSHFGTIVRGLRLTGGNANFAQFNFFGYGGGLLMFSGSISLTDNVIMTNTAVQGGGLAVISAFSQLEHNWFFGNTASRGGALYIEINESCPFNNNIFTGNQAAEYGGAIYVYSYGGVLSNNIIANNEANLSGSGIYLKGDTQLLHTTIAGNSGGDGSGIYVQSSHDTSNTVTLINSILVSQTVGISMSSGTTASLENTLWYGNGTNWAGSGTITTTNNYTGDPAFLNPNEGDYHLGPTSAAINKGIDAGILTDIDGESRDAIPDLGADENVEAPVLTIGVDGPLTATSGSLITYTLIVTNSGTITAINLVIFATIPAGAHYISGGTKVGNLVRWTVPSLAPNGGMIGRSFVVTATQTITKLNYSVQADGGYQVNGSAPGTTVITGGTENKKKLYLPLLIKN